jgi:hypothetical protein
MLAAGYFADSPIVILFTVERLYVHHHAVSAYAFILFVRIPKFDESGFEFIETSILGLEIPFARAITCPVPKIPGVADMLYWRKVGK